MRRRRWPVVIAVLAAAGLAFNLWVAGRGATAGPSPPGVMVEAEGLRLHAICAGAGKSILLLHGNPGSTLAWTETVLPPLARRHRVCAVDRPGHGFSQRGAGLADSVEGQARALRAAARALGLSAPVLVVGHSWGGAAALAYALQFPDEVAGLVLLAPVAYPDESGFAEGAERIALHPVVGPVALRVAAPFLARPLLERSLALSFAPAPVSAAYREHALSRWTHPDVLRAISADNAALTPSLGNMIHRYGEIRLPAAIVVGEADAMVDAARHGLRLRGVLPQPRLIRVPGAGHEIHFSHTDLVGNIISAVRGGTR